LNSPGAKDGSEAIRGVEHARQDLKRGRLAGSVYTQQAKTLQQHRT